MFGMHWIRNMIYISCSNFIFFEEKIELMRGLGQGVREFNTAKTT